MPCFSPLKGWRSRRANENTGNRTIVFNRREGFEDLPVTLPCGQCVGCRLDRSKNWAIRCMHEAQLHERNCFITLTYSDDHLPPGGTLVKSDFQKFMKRLRKKYGEGIRYYYCGEYGEKFGRPHYHAVLFNHDFPDKYVWRSSSAKGFSTASPSNLYRSPALEELWDLGHSSIGAVTFESAAYVARYIMKKQTGPRAVEHYNVIDYSTGEILLERHPEYNDMSRRPGIGRGWFEKYSSDVYPHDYCVIERKNKYIKVRPPKYYDRLFEVAYPSDFRKLKFARIRNAKKHEANNSYDRLAVRERIQLIKLNQLKRGYENAD